MKITYVGGGSHRVLAEVREILKMPDFINGGEIALYDLNQERGNAMEAFIKKTPEWKNCNVNVYYTNDFDKAIDSADFVELTACPSVGNDGTDVGLEVVRAGFLCSDNLSLMAAFFVKPAIDLALKIARKMEEVAPDGTFLIFTNPVPILTTAVNRYTKIRTFGICAGQANHFSDISRMMCWDKVDYKLNVEAAGVNHYSWILKMEYEGEDFFPVFDKKVKDGLDWENINEGYHWFYKKMIAAYEKFGALLFSSEADGLPHLFWYDEVVQANIKASYEPKVPDNSRNQAVEDFNKLAYENLSDEFWNDPNGPRWKGLRHQRAAVAVRIMKGFSGYEDDDATCNYLNNGAVAGFDDGKVLEYTMRFEKGKFYAKDKYKLPIATLGTCCSLVDFQSLVADGIVNSDKATYVKGIYAYPTARSENIVEPLLEKVFKANKNILPEGW